MGRNDKEEKELGEIIRMRSSILMKDKFGIENKEEKSNSAQKQEEKPKPVVPKKEKKPVITEDDLFNVEQMRKDVRDGKFSFVDNEINRPQEKNQNALGEVKENKQVQINNIQNNPKQKIEENALGTGLNKKNKNIDSSDILDDIINDLENPVRNNIISNNSQSNIDVGSGSIEAVKVENKQKNTETQLKQTVVRKTKAMSEVGKTLTEIKQQSGNINIPVDKTKNISNAPISDLFENNMENTNNNIFSGEKVADDLFNDFAGIGRQYDDFDELFGGNEVDEENNEENEAINEKKLEEEVERELEELDDDYDPLYEDDKLEDEIYEEENNINEEKNEIEKSDEVREKTFKTFEEEFEEDYNNPQIKSMDFFKKYIVKFPKREFFYAMQCIRRAVLVLKHSKKISLIPAIISFIFLFMPALVAFILSLAFSYVLYIVFILKLIIYIVIRKLNDLSEKLKNNVEKIKIACNPNRYSKWYQKVVAILTCGILLSVNGILFLSIDGLLIPFKIAKLVEKYFSDITKLSQKFLVSILRGPVDLSLVNLKRMGLVDSKGKEVEKKKKVAPISKEVEKGKTKNRLRKKEREVEKKEKINKAIGTNVNKLLKKNEEEKTKNNNKEKPKEVIVDLIKKHVEDFVKVEDTSNIKIPESKVAEEIKKAEEEAKNLDGKLIKDQVAKGRFEDNQEDLGIKEEQIGKNEALGMLTSVVTDTLKSTAIAIHETAKDIKEYRESQKKEETFPDNSKLESIKKEFTGEARFLEKPSDKAKSDINPGKQPEKPSLLGRSL